MPKLTLQHQSLKTLPPGPDGTRISYYDTVERGLVLRVGEGTRTFYFEYSIRDRSKRMRLGDVDDAVKLTDRRAEVAQLRALVSAGKDPLDERRKARDEKEGRETFEALGKRALLELEKDVRPKTHAEWSRLWKKHLLPDMGKVDARDAVAVKIAAQKMGDGIKARVVANRAFELARRIMSFAVSRDRAGHYPANPLLRVAKPEVEAEPRTRTYSADEVRRIVAASVGTLYEDLIPLLLATGTRAGEALAAEWTEIDGKTWTIPAAKSKIDHDRPVHLNPYALEILERIRAKSGEGFLFPARSESGHRERQQKVIRDIRKKSGVGDFELHDLRRVVRTGLSDLGVTNEIGELCLGHLPSKLVRTYSPHPSFWRIAEQRKAMDRWAARLAGQGGKVLRMPGV